tara:strand:+ start:521 stop:751 length:231 start_codon:yes stop_codon:yes gene_type:complete
MSDVFESRMPEKYYEDRISDAEFELYTLELQLGEVKTLEDRLDKAESLLQEIKTTNSHYQIIHKINVFFGEEGEII